ncbi:hypothetical protein BC749_11237 [Flavobacterium araucananum]|jgi:hypothetical protein|uniref:Uncharacterized protein n=1 Tax=Flavobacterium araucananum TaxID=946678 RepID=A0A227NRT5_9FLAO|nr:hypothetical protein [Flavobacterium araucananum]OXG00427.1 hypothetical protein B0A64_20210 [Flavobacterium araucananum]PWJ95792.1 hypothetical protein BC749_11237 [Flavobacterium araucananum]
MKTIKIAIVGLFLLVANATQAQVSINVNIGSPPAWGPAGYSEMEYYYLPDIEAYYDVRASQFIYFGGGRWVRTTYLPRQYRNYDLYSGYKVVLNDYHGRTPYTYFDRHRVKYYKGYYGAPQKPCRPREVYGYNERRNDRREYKHYDNRNHDKHDRDNRHDRDDRHDRGDRHDHDDHRGGRR